MKKTYTDILANAFSEIRSWKLTTVILACLCTTLVFALISQSRSTPVILVPYGFETSQGPQKVAPGGDFSASSPEYLSQIALGDLQLILNWQPDDVGVQYQRFLNRATSELYARESVRLLSEAKEHKAQGESQSFYPETVEVEIKGGRVQIDGYLVRWTGDKEVIRTKQRFNVTYKIQKGLLYVANVELTK
jgi:type IV conjugative transfer system protein TraE